MKEVEQFNSDLVYEPTNKNFLDPPQFVLDSETSTNFSFELKFRPEVMELKPLIRQYASKLFLVIIKVSETFILFLIHLFYYLVL